MFKREKVGALAQSIIDSMNQYPKKWSIGRHCAYIGHDENGPIQVWSCNGINNVGLYRPWKIDFNSTERKLIWNCFKKLEKSKTDSYANQFAETLRTEEAKL